MKGRQTSKGTRKKEMTNDIKQGGRTRKYMKEETKNDNVWTIE